MASMYTLRSESQPSNADTYFLAFPKVLLIPQMQKKMKRNSYLLAEGPNSDLQGDQGS